MTQAEVDASIALAVANYQPLNSELTAIGALTTDAFGRGVLTKANGAAIRSYIGAGTSSVNDLMLRFTFSTLTSDADPGNARFRFNNATIGSVTQMYIDLFDSDNFDVTNILDAMTGGGTLIIHELGGTGSTMAFTLGSWTTASGYRKFGLTYLMGSLPVNGQLCQLMLIPNNTVNAATTTQLALKVPTSRTVNGHALSADVTVTKGDVGLGNVDNTSDTSKPISTATQTALDGKADAADVPLVLELVSAGPGTDISYSTNQLGVTFTITNAAPGRYTITADSGTPFTTSKTFVSIQLLGAGVPPVRAAYDVTTTAITIRFYDSADAETDPGTYAVYARVYQ